MRIILTFELSELTILPGLQLLDVVDQTRVISLDVLRHQRDEEKKVEFQQSTILPPVACLVIQRRRSGQRLSVRLCGLVGMHLRLGRNHHNALGRSVDVGCLTRMFQRQEALFTPSLQVAGMAKSPPILHFVLSPSFAPNTNSSIKLLRRRRHAMH